MTQYYNPASEDLRPGEMTFKNYFGPPILETRMPDDVFTGMRKIGDKIIEKENPVNYGANLAGQIVDELAVPRQDLVDIGILDYFELMGKQFIMSSSSMLGSPMSDEFFEKVRTKITNMWLVNQIQGEYNPVHLHTRCSISAVMYLKVPRFTDRGIPNKRKQDGDITFVYSSAGDPINSFERSIMSFSPREGYMYMFPATLLHTVYPFIGQGNRVSVSFNMIHGIDDDDAFAGMYSDVFKIEDKFEGELMTEWELKTNPNNKIESNEKWFIPEQKNEQG